eukprot:gene24803-33283_t
MSATALDQHLNSLVRACDFQSPYLHNEPQFQSHPSVAKETSRAVLKMLAVNVQEVFQVV